MSNMFYNEHFKEQRGLMNKLVYLAGPIAGHTFDEAISWRDKCREMFAFNHIGVISPLRNKEFLRNGDTIGKHAYPEWGVTAGSAIVARDRNDVMRCDAVLMYLGGAKAVSIGTMVELGWADAYRKPVIVVMEQRNVHDHLFVVQLASAVATDLLEAVALVEAFVCP